MVDTIAAAAHLPPTSRPCGPPAVGRAAFEAGPPLPPPPPPATVSLEEASGLIKDNVQGWLREEFARVEARIQRAVWAASWERRALPPPEFMPRPEPTRIEAMPRGSAGIELLQCSMSGGKTWWLASCSVEALAQSPTVLGLRRRVAIVCANHLLAKETVEACRAAAAPHGLTVTWYLGYEAKAPDNPEERMCPAHALRRQANAAGLDSGRACKAETAKKGGGAEAKVAYCAHHPDNPDRTSPPCAYRSNDLDGDIVVFAGWGTLHT